MFKSGIFTKRRRCRRISAKIYHYGFCRRQRLDSIEKSSVTWLRASLVALGWTHETTRPKNTSTNATQWTRGLGSHVRRECRGLEGLGRIQMTNAEIIQNVADYQASGAFHPLTCGNCSSHRNLIPVEFSGAVGLKCLDCDYEQHWIPEMCQRFNLAEWRACWGLNQ